MKPFVITFKYRDGDVKKHIKAMVGRRKDFTPIRDALSEPRDDFRHVFRCDCCDQPVVWAVSKRTGARYLCDVTERRSRRGGSDWYFWCNLPHFKSCRKSS